MFIITRAKWFVASNLISKFQKTKFVNFVTNNSSKTHLQKVGVGSTSNKQSD